MSQGLHLGLGLLAVTLLIAGTNLFAGTTPIVPPGYKLVNVPMGGHTVPVLVKQQSDPLGHTSSLNSGLYHNPSSTFSERNVMADKTFSYGSDAFAKRTADTQSSFVTKPYQDPITGQDSRVVETPTAHLPTAAGFNSKASEMDRSYAGASANYQAHSTFAGTSTSSLQNRAAIVGGAEIGEKHETNSEANKTYLGPGAQNVPFAYNIKDNVIISRMSGLPNRPLSIDEVRDLINHGIQIDTDIKPQESSKPLNDPDYQARPLRLTPAVPSHAEDDDKDDPVPPPGTIAAPEAAEPLPQK